MVKVYFVSGGKKKKEKKEKCDDMVQRESVSHDIKYHLDCIINFPFRMVFGCVERNLI